MAEKWIEARGGLRHDIRRGLIKAGISYTETKTGMFSSIFVLDVTDTHWNQIRRTMQEAGLL